MASEKGRLAPHEIADLMKKREIPLETNECVRRFQPLVRVEGKVRCVRGELTEFCNTCPFYDSRTWREETPVSSGPNERPAGAGSVEAYPVEFVSTLREISRNRQYTFNVPISTVRDRSYLLRRLNRRFTVSITPAEEG
jgi:hypothetical protein